MTIELKFGYHYASSVIEVRYLRIEIGRLFFWAKMSA